MFPLAHHHLQTNEEHRPSATAVSRPPEEQRLLRIGIEPSVVGGTAVSLHDADGVDQRDGGLQLRTILRRGKKVTQSPRLSGQASPQNSILPTERSAGGRTWEDAEAAEMQDEREKEAREPSLDAAARRTSGSVSSLWSKKTARKRVRDDRSRARRIPRRYDASSHPRASIDAGCACAAAVAMAAFAAALSASGTQGRTGRVEGTQRRLGRAGRGWVGLGSFQGNQLYISTTSIFSLKNSTHLKTYGEVKQFQISLTKVKQFQIYLNLYKIILIYNTK